MDFLNQAAQKYMHQGQSGQGQGPSPSQGYPPHQQGSGYPAHDPNQGLPPGWHAEWDAPDNRWFYINQHTGERTFNRPGGAPHSDPSQGLPPGWIAEWDAPDQRWFYVNTRDGERTFNRPGPPHGSYGPPPSQYPSGGYQQAPAPTQAAAPAAKNHNMAYGAAGAVGGLLAGGLLMHEGEKVGRCLMVHRRFEVQAIGC